MLVGWLHDEEKLSARTLGWSRRDVTSNKMSAEKIQQAESLAARDDWIVLSHIRMLAETGHSAIVKRSAVLKYFSDSGSRFISSQTQIANLAACVIMGR
jgi:hypothetical protein